MYKELELFAKNLGAEVQTDAPMSKYTSFKAGGNASVLITPDSLDTLKRTVSFCRENNVKMFVIGNGSNLLVTDKGFDGAIIKIGSSLSSIELVDDCTVKCEAGASMKALCMFALENSLSGLEFAYGIPGTLGGAVYMNAGAYGGEMKDVLVSCRYIDENGKIKELPLEKMELSYRHSFFSERELCITSVKMRLQKGERDKIKDRMDTLMERRRDKQPLEYPSAGSTFKRPEGDFAARLIEVCGLKGTSCGGAEVSTKHSGFVINKGNATFKDVMGVVDTVKQKVKEQTGVTLECEVLIME